MSVYKAKTVRVAHSAAAIADKFADLTVLESLKDKMPEGELSQLGRLTFEPDAIVVDTPQLGAVRFAVKERTPQVVRFAAEGTPVPLGVAVDLDAVAPDATDITTSVDIDIPPMLRPFIGSKISKMVDGLGAVIAKIAER